MDENLIFQAFRRRGTRMIYSMSNSVVASGKLAEWQNISENELVPIFPKLGMKLVGSWHAYSGDVNSTYTLFSFDSMAAMEKAREANQKNKTYQTISAKLDTNSVFSSSPILGQTLKNLHQETKYIFGQQLI
jgi:hypothetical protein